MSHHGEMIWGGPLVFISGFTAVCSAGAKGEMTVMYWQKPPLFSFFFNPGLPSFSLSQPTLLPFALFTPVFNRAYFYPLAHRAYSNTELQLGVSLTTPMPCTHTGALCGESNLLLPPPFFVCVGMKACVPICFFCQGVMLPHLRRFPVCWVKWTFLNVAARHINARTPDCSFPSGSGKKSGRCNWRSSSSFTSANRFLFWLYPTQLSRQVTSY